MRILKHSAALAILASIVIAQPHQVHAATTGFAPSSFFASNTQVAEGDTVTLFTVLYNGSDAAFSGDVATHHFNLDAGATRIVDAKWIAKTGEHTATARVTNVRSARTQDVNADADDIPLVVAPAPPPSRVEQAAGVVLQKMQVGAAAIGNAAQTTRRSLETIRKDIARTLSSHSTQSESRGVSHSTGGSDSKVLGTSTKAVFHPAANTSRGDEAKTAFARLAYAATDNRLVFYPLLALSVYLLWRVLKFVIIRR